MKLDALQAVLWGGGALTLVIAAASGGYWLGQRGHDAGPNGTTQMERKVLYWYDPMVPQEHYDNPNSLSSMGMKTVPKYADDAPSTTAAPGVNIDPSARRNLGLRVAAAEVGIVPSSLTVAGTIDFNQRNVAVIQARSAGFVTRVYGRAPGDVIGAGAPLADLQLSEWGGAQAEFLAVKRLGRTDLTAAARQRLRLLGMPDSLIFQVERTGRTNGVVAITSPIAGVIQTLEARTGAALAQGQTLAQVTGLTTVWLNAAVPEAQSGAIRIGQRASAVLAAFPGKPFAGRVIAILPTAQAESRTLTVRMELANPGGRLRPGMFASVSLGGDDRPGLLVPSEAIIRTGLRTLVMLAQADGRYRPAEVRIGREGGGKTEVLRGLRAGEKVVASGQFLLDSEASLSGVAARAIGGDK